MSVWTLLSLPAAPPANGAAGRRATWLELFFDLVFVAAVAQVGGPLHTNALITDLVVLEPYRGRGIGRRLLERAEAYAKYASATELRIGVLANNGTARRLYLDAGFQPHLEVLNKRW